MFKKLTRNYLVALSFLALLAVVSFFSLQHFLQQRETDAYMINVSGQQRFLSQRIALLSLEIVNIQDKQQQTSLRNELVDAINNIEEVHKILEENEQVPIKEKLFKTKRYRGNKIKTIYYDTVFSLDKKIHEYSMEARALSAASDSELVLTNPHLQFILATNPDILEATNVVVSEYQKFSEKGIKALLILKTITFIATLIALLLVGWLLFKPMVQEIHNNLIALGEKEEELQLFNRELEQRVTDRTLELTKMNQILVREITDHQQTADRLKVLTDAMEQIDDIIIITDTNGVVQFVNSSYEKKTGFTKAEAIGQNSRILKSGFHSKEFYENIWNTILSGKTYNGIILNKTKNGEFYHERRTITPIKVRSEDITHFVSSGQDITEQIKKEDIIKETYNFNQTLLQTIPLGMQVVGQDGTILFMNKQMEIQAGENAIGRKCWEVICDNKQQCEKCLVPVCPNHTQTELPEGEICGIEQSGIFDNKTVQIFFSPIEYQKQKAILEVFIDITKLKETEKKLLYKNKELNTFVYRASHDIRGPLVSVIGLTNIALSEAKDPVIIPYLEYIRQSVHRLDSLLVDFVRVINIKENLLKTSPVDFKQVIDKVINDLKYQYVTEYDKITIKTEIKQNSIFYSDNSLLQSVLQNLLGNGIKYRKQESNESYLHLSIREYKQGVLITVEDNGIGMNKETQEKAFDMFYRGTDTVEGTGLGLYIVMNTVEKLKGNIDLKSEPDNGTTFTLYLPNLIGM